MIRRLDNCAGSCQIVAHPVLLTEGFDLGLRTGIALYVRYFGPPGIFIIFPLTLAGGGALGNRLLLRLLLLLLLLPLLLPLDDDPVLLDPSVKL